MEIQVWDDAAADPMWDAFLASQLAGHHVQSSAWGALKAKFGWQVVRILAREADQITGGVQILIRKLPVGGGIGYISKGPVVAPGRADVMAELMARIERVARARHLVVLSIQPPENDPLYMAPLELRRFRPSSFYVVPPATVLVDLQPDAEEILKQMKSKTRYNIRLAERKGIVIREGSEADLETFYQLTKVTADRTTAYTHYDLAYYQEAWRQFAPHNWMKLFIAEYEGEPLGSLIATAFGAWGVYKWGASSDAHREKMPNHLLQWTAMQWCKAQGCHTYDLGGITPVVAEMLRAGTPVESIEHPSAGVARFKLTFGDMVSFPDSYDNSYGIFPAGLVRWGVALAWRAPVFRGLVRGASGA